MRNIAISIVAVVLILVGIRAVALSRENRASRETELKGADASVSDTNDYSSFQMRDDINDIICEVMGDHHVYFFFTWSVSEEEAATTNCTSLEDAKGLAEVFAKGASEPMYVAVSLERYPAYTENWIIGALLLNEGRKLDKLRFLYLGRDERLAEIEKLARGLNIDFHFRYHPDYRGVAFRLNGRSFSGQVAPAYDKLPVVDDLHAELLLVPLTNDVLECVIDGKATIGRLNEDGRIVCSNGLEFFAKDYTIQRVFQILAEANIMLHTPQFGTPPLKGGEVDPVEESVSEIIFLQQTGGEFGTTTIEWREEE